MFEREAEQYERKVDSENVHDEWGQVDYRFCDIIDAFKDGAEYGYAKALEEIADLKDCSNCKHWEYSTRSLSYYCEKTGRCDDCKTQGYSCEHWEY